MARHHTPCRCDWLALPDELVWGLMHENESDRPTMLFPQCIRLLPDLLGHVAKAN